MPSEIKCPNCGHEFNADKQLQDALEQKYKQDYERKLRDANNANTAIQQQLNKEREEFEEKKRNENELFAKKLQERIADEKKKIKEETETILRKSISDDYENQLQILKSRADDTEEKLKTARQKELEMMQKEQALLKEKEELDLEVQRRLFDARKGMQEELKQQETIRIKMVEEEYQEKLKKKEIQLEAQIKLAEEMKRKAEQASMQLQGEVHELLLEESLRNMYPFDEISEVKKGAEGADCVQTIRSNTGNTCGMIVYESKDTKGWSNTWIPKLKAFQRSQNADAAILVTTAFPSDMSRFGEKEGVWVCRFDDLPGLSAILRQSIIKQHDVQRSQVNKGEKMQMLYEFLTGTEFRGQVESIAEGFQIIKNNINKERIAMEKLWKEREKQLEKVLLSTAGMYGSIKGIAGEGIGHIPLLDGDDDRALEDK